MTTPDAVMPRLPWDPHDPYPYYEHCRAAGDVVWDDGAGAWLVVGYHAARQVLSAPGWRHPLSDPRAQEAMDPLGRELVNRNMLFVDGDRHALLRGALGEAFAPRNVRELKTGVDVMADGIVGYVPTAVPFNFLAEVALPLPIAVSAAWLALDGSSVQLLRDQSPPISRMLGEFADPDSVAAGVAALAALLADFLPLAADRRKHSGDDLLSYVAADPELDLEDVAMTAILLAVAGHETTANMLGAAMIRLLQPDDRGVRLVDTVNAGDPSLITELLRLDGPVHSTARTAVDAHRIAGVDIAPGQGVVVVLAAANRDPAVFEAPHEFRLGRRAPAPLSFSHGAHYCVGAALARLMIDATLSRALARRPVLLGPATWRDAAGIRGLTDVPLVFER